MALWKRDAEMEESTKKNVHTIKISTYPLQGQHFFHSVDLYTLGNNSPVQIEDSDNLALDIWYPYT